MTQKPLLQYLKQKQYWVNALMTMFFVLYINRMYSGGSEYGWLNLHGMPGLVDFDCHGNGVCRDVSAIGI